MTVSDEQTQQQDQSNQDQQQQSHNDSSANTNVEALQQELDRLRNHNQTLLNEKKSEQRKREEAAAAAEQAKLEKAKKDGDFEQLLKSSESERNKLQESYNQLKTRIESEKINNEAMKLAAELADGTNAELLSEFVKKRLKMSDDGVKVLNESGDLTVSSIEDLKNEIVKSGKYNALLRGNQSSGGGAPGNHGGAAGNKNKATLAEFNEMSPADRMKFAKAGGSIED